MFSTVIYHVYSARSHKKVSQHVTLFIVPSLRETILHTHTHVLVLENRTQFTASILYSGQISTYTRYLPTYICQYYTSKETSTPVVSSYILYKNISTVKKHVLFKESLP